MKKAQIYVKNIEQKILWEAELMGQFSDGFWENSKNRSWKYLNSIANIDSKNPRLENSRHYITSYNTANKQLLQYIGFRMLGFARTARLFQEVPSSYYFQEIIEHLFNYKLVKEKLNKGEKEIIGISQDKKLKQIKFEKNEVFKQLQELKTRINPKNPFSKDYLETIEWCNKNINKLLDEINREYYIKDLLNDLTDIKYIMNNNYSLREKQEKEKKLKQENNLELNFN